MKIFEESSRPFGEQLVTLVELVYLELLFCFKSHSLEPQQIASSLWKRLKIVLNWDPEQKGPSPDSTASKRKQSGPLHNRRKLAYESAQAISLQSFRIPLSN